MKRTLIIMFAMVMVASLATVSTALEMDEESKAAEETVEVTDFNEGGVDVSARAVITGTKGDSEISGTVDFIEAGDGVQVVAVLSNVKPAGKHGFHVHENGSCDKGGKAAGGHFNPAGTDHGFLPEDSHDKAHLGDMGNITIDENGDGHLVLFMPGLSLTEGDHNISGKAVILHAKEDDFGQPTGNAGGRIGCGIITSN